MYKYRIKILYIIITLNYIIQLVSTGYLSWESYSEVVMNRKNQIQSFLYSLEELNKIYNKQSAIESLQVVDISEECPSDYQQLTFNQWPGTQHGCYSQESHALQIVDNFLLICNSFGGDIDYPKNGKIDYKIWNNSKFCWKETQLIQNPDQNIDCSTFELQACGNVCSQLLKDCPITDIIIQTTDSTPEGYTKVSSASASIFVYTTKTQLTATTYPITDIRISKGESTCFLQNFVVSNLQKYSDHILMIQDVKTDCQPYGTIGKELAISTEDAILEQNDIWNQINIMPEDYKMTIETIKNIMTLSQIDLIAYKSQQCYDEIKSLIEISFPILEYYLDQTFTLYEITFYVCIFQVFTAIISLLAFRINSKFNILQDQYQFNLLYPLIIGACINYFIFGFFLMITFSLKVHNTNHFIDQIIDQVKELKIDQDCFLNLTDLNYIQAQFSDQKNYEFFDYFNSQNIQNLSIKMITVMANGTLLLIFYLIIRGKKYKKQKDD